MSDPATTERPFATLDEELPSLDPLEETEQRMRVVLSRHPLRAVLIIFFVAGAFVAGAAVSGIIEDLVAAWFREEVIHFLTRSTVSNGWVVLLVTVGITFLTILLMLAIRNYRRAGELSTSLDARDRLISELQGVLDNQKRLLDHFQRDRAFQEDRFERLATQVREQMEKEREVLSILDEALVLMVHSILNGREPPAKARRRFFGVYKRTVPQLFTHPEDIRNACVLEPDGDYLCFSSHCTVPLPPEVERIAKYYIGDDDFRRYEAGLEGRMYVQIDDGDNNLEDIDPVIVGVSNRLEDRAPGCNDYIGFYGRAGLAAPFASYIVIPISHQWGVLRIESLAKDTFGPSQYELLKQIARKLNLAFSVSSALDIEISG